MGWLSFGKGGNPKEALGWVPEKKLMDEKEKLRPTELGNRVKRLDALVTHNSSSSESKELCCIGGNVFRSWAESANGKPIGKRIACVNLDLVELDEPKLIQEISAAHERKEETYLVQKSQEHAELIIVKPVSEKA